MKLHGNNNTAVMPSLLPEGFNPFAWRYINCYVCYIIIKYQAASWLCGTIWRIWSTAVEPRIIKINAKHDIEETIEIVWADDGRNTIINHSEIFDKLNRILSEIISTKTDGLPILIMFYEKGIRVIKSRLINRITNMYITWENSIQNITIYYTTYYH